MNSFMGEKSTSSEDNSVIQQNVETRNCYSPCEIDDEDDIISFTNTTEPSPKSEIFPDHNFFKRLRAYLSIRYWEKKPVRVPEYKEIQFERQTPLSEKIWFLSDNVNLVLRLHKTAKLLKTMTCSEDYYLYMRNEDMDEIFIFPNNWETFYELRYSWKIRRGDTIATYVMQTKSAVIVDTSVTDARFVLGQDIPGSSATNILAVPIMNLQGFCIGVLEFYRENEVPYEMEHIKYASLLLKFAGESISQNKRRVINGAVLENFLALFKELHKGMTSVLGIPSKCEDNKISFYITILEFLTKLTNAEKVSIFLAKEGKVEARISTDVSCDVRTTKAMLEKELQLVNMTLNTGFILNIADLFNDPRFDKEVDIESGYVTRSVLNVPLRGKRHSVGVLQSINKLSGGDSFSDADEFGVTRMSTFGSLWYFYTYLVDHLNRQICKWKFFEQIIYGVISRPTVDAEPFNVRKLTCVPPMLKTFNFNLNAYPENKWPRFAYLMFKDIAGVEMFDPEDLWNFVNMGKILHGEHVLGFRFALGISQLLYCILNIYPVLFDYETKICLMIAGFCTGFLRDYPSLEKLKKRDDPLLHIFDNFVVERTGFQSAKFLIKCSSLFKKFSSSEQEDLINMIEELILSSSFGHHRLKEIEKIGRLSLKNEFDFTIPEHKYLLKALIMFITVNQSAFALRPCFFRHYVHARIQKIITDTQGDKYDKSGSLQLQLKTYYFYVSKLLENMALPDCKILTSLLPNLRNLYINVSNNYKAMINVVNSDLNLSEAENKFFCEDSDEKYAGDDEDD